MKGSGSAHKRLPAVVGRRQAVLYLAHVQICNLKATNRAAARFVYALLFNRDHQHVDVQLIDGMAGR